MSEDLEVALLRSSAAHVARALLVPLAPSAIVLGLSAALSAKFLPFMIVAAFVALGLGTEFIAKPRAVVARGPIAVCNGVVSIGSVFVVRRSQVQEGIVLPHAIGGTIVRLVTGRGTIDLRVANVDQARAVLESLGLDAAHHAATFTIRARSRATFMRRVGISLAVFLAYVAAIVLTGGLLRTPVFAALMPFAAVFLALSLALPTRVTVGTDGLVLRRGLGRRVFVPLDEIEKAVVVKGEVSMNATPINVELRTSIGEIREELFVDARKEGPFQEVAHARLKDRAEGLAERINEAIAARKQAKSIDPATLARGERSARAWVLDLRSLLAHAETFRAAPPTIESLAAVVDDGSAPAITRAAAAAALSSMGHEVRARLRVAAEATAAPHLRVALEAAAENDLDRLTEAIEEIERAS